MNHKPFIKMKNLLLIIAIVFSLGVSFAAHAQSNYDQVTLNVRLYPIQTIVVNPAQRTVNLDYSSPDDYNDGVSIELEDHLSIYSTGGFAVKVKSSSSTLESQHNDVTEDIDASDIKITATDGTNSSGSTFTDLNLTDQYEVLISNNTGGVNKNYNITYEAAGGDTYINKYFDVENPTTYSTYVQYTIEAQ